MRACLSPATWPSRAVVLCLIRCLVFFPGPRVVYRECTTMFRSTVYLACWKGYVRPPDPRAPTSMPNSER